MYELEHARHRKYWESKGDVYLGIWLCRLEHSFLGTQSRSMSIAISRCHIREILFLAWNDSDPDCDLKDRRFQKQFDFVLSPLLPHGDLSETCSDIVRRHFLEPGSDSPSTRLQNDCLTLSGFRKVKYPWVMDADIREGRKDGVYTRETCRSFWNLWAETACNKLSLREERTSGMIPSAPYSD